MYERVSAAVIKPSFNTLQNYGSGATLHYYVFDLLVMCPFGKPA
jgi:hypothetical protein